MTHKTETIKPSTSLASPAAIDPQEPSPWVTRFAPLVPADGDVLDVACGAGRHMRYFHDRGHPVTGLDRDLGGLADLIGAAGVTTLRADLEDGSPWALGDRRFAGVVVTNYLWRPLLPRIVDSVAPGGVLIYETFARGNEAFGRPSNPAFLLQPGELLEAVRGKLTVVAYENLAVDHPRPALVQRICATRA